LLLHASCLPTHRSGTRLGVTTPSSHHSRKPYIHVSAAPHCASFALGELWGRVLSGSLSIGAGISDNRTTVRTPWPLTGGSINVTLHDAAAYLWINIGLGVNTTNFNYTLFSVPLNETGAGNLCFPQLTLPAGLPISEGTNASIQFATAGHNGEGLYNCADITFTANAILLPSNQCVNSSTVSITPFTYGSSTSSSGSSSSSASSASASSASASATKAGAAAGFAPSSAVLVLASLLAAVFCTQA